MNTAFTIGISSLFLGLAAAGLAATLVRLVNSSRGQLDRANDHDVNRRRRIAAGDVGHRLVRPLLMEMAAWSWLRSLTKPDAIARHLDVGTESLPWNADEYLGAKSFDAILAAVMVAAGGAWYWDVITGLMLGAGWMAWGLTQVEPTLRGRASRRQEAIDRRLPYAIDLMALMMAAGATVYDCVKVVMRESAGHPIGDEFRRIHQTIERGGSLEDALFELRERLQTDAVAELAVVVKLGVAQGTPLGESFLGLADQMRLRRSQAAEKAAGQAHTMITFPAMVVMVACLAIIVAPFAVTAFS